MNSANTNPELLDSTQGSGPLDIMDIVVITADGNLSVVLENELGFPHKSFLVSIDIVSLASPILNGLIKWANKGDGNGPLTITLRENEVNAMEDILSILHYQFDRVQAFHTPQQLAKLAITSEIYGLQKAMGDWAYRRCTPVILDPLDVNLAEQVGYLLLTAHLFQLEGRFNWISRWFFKWAKSNMEFGELWQRHEIISHLPKWITGKYYLAIFDSPSPERSMDV